MFRSLSLVSLILVLAFTSSCFQRGTVSSNSQPISFDDWNELLQKHVSAQGNVDYQGFKDDSPQLNSFLTKLKAHHPNDKNWSEAEQIAYWINAYNAFTVKLIVDNYPLKSIKEIGGSIPFVNTSWDIKFFEIEKNLYDLNDIEHGILRKKYVEPRIHFAVNCASVSCPRLLNEAFVPERLEEQLTQVATSFINNETKNLITPQKASLSKIFSWFSGDFEKTHDNITAFINQYSKVKITDQTKIEYMDYDWNLNE